MRGTIDHFFRSLAVDQGANAVAIVLSGIGAEGTLGARAVKGEGGLVIAQDPNTASQSGMPANLIGAGLADFVSAPDKMPRALLDYARGVHVHQAALAEAPETRPFNGLQSILAVLRAQTKHDFRGYKTGTLHRRIKRRMALQQISSAPKYVDFLRSHPAETAQLAKDLLIGVTSFFRDPQAFEELASKVLTGLVKERDPDTPIRVWVPGCATGEEAYSIAILLTERIAAVTITMSDADLCHGRGRKRAGHRAAAGRTPRPFHSMSARNASSGSSHARIIGTRSSSLCANR